MLEVTNDSQTTENSTKSEKVQTNLKLIKSLLKGALKELKESERFSTNESDTSESFSPERIRNFSID